MTIDLLSVIPGQGRRRKMPERSVTEDQQYQTLDDYYCVRVFYVFYIQYHTNCKEDLRLGTTQH